MSNKIDFFFVCTYTNRPTKESRLHVLYPYLYLDILWQCAISRSFSVKLTTLAPSEVMKFSYPNLLQSVELYLWSVVSLSFRKERISLSQQLLFFPHEGSMSFTLLYLENTLFPWTLTSWWLSWSSWALPLSYSQQWKLFNSFWHKQK